VSNDITDINFVDLRDKPELLGTAAERIWRAWSKDRGLSLEQVVQKLEGIKSSESEFTLVAHARDNFLGTISVIGSDMVERPNLTPWIAAVWVEREYRKHRLGSALVREAEQHAQDREVDLLYLCCAPELRPFYSGLGWREIESNVGAKNSCVFEKRLLQTALIV
jgi:predicted N-acetyltransferase YhbS